jgi:hypothetical protein
MKKALFIVVLYLVPFFSFSNIFENGTIHLVSPKMDTVTEYQCSVGKHKDTKSTIQGEIPNTVEGRSQLIANCDDFLIERHNIIIESGSYCQRQGVTVVGTTDPSRRESEEKMRSFTNGYCQPGYLTNGSISKVTILQVTEGSSCPPNDYPSYVAYYAPTEQDVKCYDPTQLDLLDSCSVSSGNEYLSIPVTSPSGCYPQSDGSICKYDAVNVGGGNEYYALDLEGDCYDNPEDLPELAGTPQDPPVDETCADYGNGVLACPEDPSNVCSSGSSYAGGSVQDCQTGCGMVNDQFLCIDTDIDGDGLPDYNDPDIDGDGIPNGDDLDSDGNGTDDPINGGGGGGGGSELNLDLGPVINELKKTNESLDTIESSFKTDHGLEPDGLNKDGRLDELNNDYQLDLEEFIAKGSTELGYTDKLVLGNSSALSALPSNVCNPYSFHIAGQTLAFDVCPAAEKAKPILYWLVGMLTAWHIFFLINATLRGPI